MPVKGAKLQPDSRTRHAPTHDWVEVERVPFLGAPKPPNLAKQPAATRRWWRVVSRMPHCILWDESDWQFAFDTIVSHRRFILGEAGADTALRIREKVLGTTLDYRRDLRIRYVEPAEREEERQGEVALLKYRKAIAG